MPLDPAMNRICGEQLVGKVSHVVRLFFIQRAAAWGAPDGLLSLAGIWSAEGGEDLAELGGVPVPEEVRAVFRDEARSQRLAAITASDCGSAESYLVTCIAAIKRGTEHSAEDDALALHYFDLFTRVTEPQNASRAAPLIAPAQQRQKARQAAAAAGSAPAAMTQAPATTAAATAAAAATPLRYRATRDPMAEFD